MYNAYSFMTLALDGMSDQRHALAALYPWGSKHGTYGTVRWVGLRAGLETEVREKILAFAEDRTPVVQSVIRHYTD
jgi:hypothetical protein